MDKSTDHDKPYFDFCIFMLFFLRQYQRQKKCFLSERELKKSIARHIDGWDLVTFDWFVLSMRMQVILDSSFACPGSVPIWGGKKGEFRDWTKLNQAQNWSWEAENHCFISNLTNPINKMFLKLIYLKSSTFPSVKTTVHTLIGVRNETSLLKIR